MENETQIIEAQREAPARAKQGVSLRSVVFGMSVLVLVFVVIVMFTVHATNDAYLDLEKASEDYVLGESAANDMKAGSNYLTISARSFVVTQDPEYLEEYFWEADENMSRDKAVETIRSLQGGNTARLEEALATSVDLMDLEYYAMRLVTEAEGMTELQNKYLPDVVLSAEDAALSADAKIALATSMMFGEEYANYVDEIEESVALCKADLMDSIEQIRDAGQAKLDTLLWVHRILVVLLFLGVLGMIFAIVLLVVRPLRAYSSHISDNDKLPDSGAKELRAMADAYNEMYTENMRNHDILRQKAEHDPLTGLYNRGVFEKLLELHAQDDYAIIIVDFDNFKSVNDTLGHDTGDAALQKLARLLQGAFRTTDYPCRLGGDEFVVFMTEMTGDLRYVVEAKVKSVMEGLQDTSDGLPPFTVSAGIAFSDEALSGEQVFKHADQALYKVKETGRNGFGFYDE